MSVGTRVPGEPRDHVVQFYERDEQLVATVGAYLADALTAGESALVVATEAHRLAFLGAVADAGVDVAAARRRGRLVTLDAAETLAEFMTDAGPDAAAFDAVVGGLVRRLGAPGRPLRVYGEMVALLWDAGQVPAAIELETLWNGLGRHVDFSLFCAYPVDAAADGHVEVCRLHSAVVGGEAVREFDHDPQAPREARRFVVETLCRWGFDHIVDDAATVVTELVTNAVVHARSAAVVAVSSRHDAVRISVRDASAVLPATRQGAGTGATGRGIALVAAMAGSYGTQPLVDGKVVWADLPTNGRLS